MARRNQSAERAADRTAKPPVKKGFTLSADADRRLTTASLVEGKDQSTIVDSLILTHLVGYYAGRRGHAEESEDTEAA